MSSNNVLHARHIIKPPLLIFWHHSATWSCKSASHKVSNNNLAFMITSIFLLQLVTQKLAKQKKRKQFLIIIDSISSLEFRIPFSYPFCFHLLFQYYHRIIAWSHLETSKKRPGFLARPWILESKDCTWSWSPQGSDASTGWSGDDYRML